MGSADKPSTKKPYTPPVLIIYGDVHKITQGTHSQGHKDSASSLFRTGAG